MRPQQLTMAVKRAIRLKKPMMIHGSPGIGKSEIVDQAREEIGYKNLVDLRMSQIDQVDLRGVPSVDNKSKLTLWNPPAFLPREASTVLFLDEINSASAGVMAAAYELILDRRVGDYKLPDDCAIIAAGNLMTDFAMVNQMPSALKSRMTHVTLEPNLDDWVDWAITKGQVHEAVISFLRFRPNMLFEFEQTNKTKEAKAKARNMREATAFATPRTWKIMSDYVHDGIEPEIEYECYTGIVGEAAAAEFTAFQKHYRSLPNLDTVLMNPKSAPVPEEPATLYALATGLASRATPDNMDRVIQYVDRIGKEFQVMTIRDATKRNAECSFTKAFEQWAVRNGDLI